MLIRAKGKHGPPSFYRQLSERGRHFLLLSNMGRVIHLLPSNRRGAVGGKTDIRQGTLALMILKTLEAMGPQHGYGLARRIEQTSDGALSVNYGTLYPALLKLEQEGHVSSEWGVSDNNRRAKYYKLTRAGRKQLAEESREWERTTAILARFFAPAEEP
jgi:PadR family transcriptional regulator, regulatory protein PadR